MPIRTKAGRRYRSIMIALLIGTLAVAFCSLFLGRFAMSPAEVVQILHDHLLGRASQSTQDTVVWTIRVPRALVAILVGAGLSLSGAAFQGIFFNPLVSPDILGVSNGAGFGATLGILLAASGISGFTTPLAFVFGLVSVALTYGISRLRSGGNVLSLVLSGIVVGSIFSALISLIKLVADTDSALPAITYWLMGSFANTTFGDLRIILVPILIGAGILMALRWRINILSLGDDEAQALGVNPVRIRLLAIAACTIITAACVTVSGIIGWVGLILPNLCRRFISADHRMLLPAACLTGSLFMLIVDLLARSVTAAEIPIGILTALVGAPFFILIYRDKRA